MIYRNEQDNILVDLEEIKWVSHLSRNLGYCESGICGIISGRKRLRRKQSSTLNKLGRFGLETIEAYKRLSPEIRDSQVCKGGIEYLERLCTVLCSSGKSQTEKINEAVAYASAIDAKENQDRG